MQIQRFVSTAFFLACVLEGGAAVLGCGGRVIGDGFEDPRAGDEDGEDGSSTPPRDMSPSGCASGQTEACYCDDGRSGARECRANRQWGRCTCTGTGDVCGDGRVTGREFCDGAAFLGETCATVTMGTLPIGRLQCTDWCTFDTRDCRGGSPGAGGFGGSSGVGGFGGLVGGGAVGGF